MAFSGQRKLAFDTGFNDALFGRDNDNPYNPATVAGSVAAYEEGYDLGLISDIPPRGPQGEQGDTGEAGSNGKPGGRGPPGNQHLVGSGVPSNLIGDNGDVYTDDENGYIYTKSGGTWSLSGTAGMDRARLMRYFLGE